MFNLCSTDHYITHKKARRLGCKGVEVELVVEGIKGVEYTEQTMIYDVVLVDKNGDIHTYPCYGLEKISSAAPPPEKKSYKDMCKKFGVDQREVQKPREIDVLISMRSSSHHPNPVKRLGEMTLYDGIYGKVFGGTDPHLKFTPHQASYLPWCMRSIEELLKLCGQLLRMLLWSPLQRQRKSSWITSNKKILVLSVIRSVGVADVASVRWDPSQCL